VRKLYIDEIFKFYRSLVYLQEKKGEIKEGSFERITEGENTVASLRKQLFKIKS
jgi:hypothetical protein